MTIWGYLVTELTVTFNTVHDGNNLTALSFHLNTKAPNHYAFESLKPETEDCKARLQLFF